MKPIQILCAAACGAAIVGAGLALASPSYAASHGHGGGHGHGKGHSMSSATGAAGKASDVTRTVEVTMRDNFYEPENIAIANGETVRFVITNAGELVHEFNIGTAAMHAKHQEEMMMMVEHGALEADRIHHDRMKMDMGGGKTMEHNDPNAVLLEPGQSGEVIWSFTTDAELEFACNVPGHYDAGMMGHIRFQ
ncbi:MAG: cupredoxin family protein [Alphaproteobacteria bacterium]